MAEREFEIVDVGNGRVVVREANGDSKQIVLAGILNDVGFRLNGKLDHDDNCNFVYSSGIKMDEFRIGLAEGEKLRTGSLTSINKLVQY